MPRFFKLPREGIRQSLHITTKYSLYDAQQIFIAVLKNQLLMMRMEEGNAVKNIECVVKVTNTGAKLHGLLQPRLC